MNRGDSPACLVLHDRQIGGGPDPLRRPSCVAEQECQGHAVAASVGRCDQLLRVGARLVAEARGEGVWRVAGDIVVLPYGHAHAISNGRGYRLVDSTKLLHDMLGGSIVHEKAGGGGAVTKLICSYFGCERHAERMFLAGLPPVFKVNVRGDAAGSWIESSIRHSLEKVASERAGRGALLAKLSEALFMETLCLYMEELPPERTGWLAGARDEAVGRALASLHRAPSRAWSLDDLARAAGVSRTILVERFTHFLGQPPLAYLARWRHQLAARLLETSDRNVLQVALDVGYESEAAFSRAFRREFGIPPARYRRRHREGRGDRPGGASDGAPEGA